MPPGTERSPPSGRRVFSRITSPFASSSRNITDFTIQAPEGRDLFNSRYAPGDIVSGYVRLRVAKPIRITHVVVCLHGFAQVYKTPGSPGEGFRANSAYLGTGRGKKSGEYFGNGFASLFEDEEVLCGDGRLAEGEYRFNFELEFPKAGLPSSIDFERGTVSYMVTATLTRPHTMSPTMSHDRKITLVETIDIAPLEPPESRTITLHPVGKRSRPKSSAKKLADGSEKSRNSTTESQETDIPRQSIASSASGSHAPGDSPEDGAQSINSHVSSSRRASQADSQSGGSPSSTPTPTLSELGSGSTSRLSLANKVIVAKIESQAGGCLPGHSIPVKINVSHTKPLRSVYGVILTLFRQARVDMHPSLPLGPIERGKERKYDYYPKSKTGLGGLSLSGAGSSHVFRKELSQSLASLFIDPETLASEVSAKVRVPEEAFPTISSVPGAMISFRYYVEVIVDIQGKLQGLEKSVNNLAGQLPPTGHYLNSEGSVMERSAVTPFGSTIIDTASVRRDKGVVTCTFEVIIGTKDSDLRKGKQKMIEAVKEAEGQSQPLPTQEALTDPQEMQSPKAYYGVDGSYHYQWYDEPSYSNLPQDQQQYEAFHDQRPPPPHVPIPQMPDESQMTEKERIRYAETQLLPSQPPGMDYEDEDSTVGATAPLLPDESTNGLVQTTSPVLPAYRAVASSSMAQTSNTGTSGEPTEAHTGFTSATAQAVATPSAISMPVEFNEKEDQRRQQLLAEASAPPSHEPGQDEAGSAPILGASAPTLHEVEELFDHVNDAHADAAGSNELPMYQQ